MRYFVNGWWIFSKKRYHFCGQSSRRVPREVAEGVLKWPKLVCWPPPPGGYICRNLKKILCRAPILPLIAPAPSPHSTDISAMNIQEETRRLPPGRLHGTPLQCNVTWTLPDNKIFQWNNHIEYESEATRNKTPSTVTLKKKLFAVSNVTSSYFNYFCATDNRHPRNPQCFQLIPVKITRFYCWVSVLSFGRKSVQSRLDNIHSLRFTGVVV